jgi:hypothetical protein
VACSAAPAEPRPEASAVCPELDVAGSESHVVTTVDDAVLVAVPCIHYLQNIGWRLVVVRDGGVRPVDVPQVDPETLAVADETYLLSVAIPAEGVAAGTFEASLHSEADGCGAWASYAFDGEDVDLAEVREEPCHAWGALVTGPEGWAIAFPPDRRPAEAAALAAVAGAGLPCTVDDGDEPEVLTRAGSAVVVGVPCDRVEFNADWHLLAVQGDEVVALGRPVVALDFDPGPDGRFSSFRFRQDGCGTWTSYRFDGSTVRRARSPRPTDC